MYADDIALITPSKETTQAALNLLQEWTVQWHMSFNVSKCGCIHYSPLLSTFNLTINNQPLPIVQHYKYLGIYFHKSTTFDFHFEKLSAKLLATSNQLIPILKNRFIPTENQITIIKERLINKYNYAIETWGADPVIQNKLQIILNKSLRRIIGGHYTCSTWALLTELNIPHVKTSYKRGLLGLASRLFHSSQPIPLWASNSTIPDAQLESFPLAYGQKLLRQQELLPLTKLPLKKHRTKWFSKWKRQHTFAIIKHKATLPNAPKGLKKYLTFLEQHEHVKETPPKFSYINSIIKIPTDDPDITRDFIIRPMAINAIIKIRTFNYPFMPILKHRYPPNKLSNKCLLCSLNQTESLHHILTQCTAYDNLQRHFGTHYIVGQKQWLIFLGLQQRCSELLRHSTHR